MLEKHVEELQNHNAQLMEENNRLTKALARHEEKQNFVEHGGALIELRPGGSYSETPVCPKCRSTLWTNEDFLEFECSSCGHMANLTPNSLKKFIAHKT